MRNAVKRAVTPPRVRTSERTRHTHGRTHAAACAAVWCVFVVLLNTGCGTTLKAADCEQLSAAAGEKHCPERVIDRPVPQPATFDVPAPADPPPLTAAALEAPTVLEALRAVAADLAATRAWGWQLYYQVENIKRANDALADDN